MIQRGCFGCIGDAKSSELLQRVFDPLSVLMPLLCEYGLLVDITFSICGERDGRGSFF